MCDVCDGLYCDFDDCVLDYNYVDYFDDVYGVLLFSTLIYYDDSSWPWFMMG